MVLRKNYKLPKIKSLHLNKVINERFQSHFSDNALMILNFLPKFVHLYGQEFGGVLEKNLLLPRFLVKNAKNNVFEDKWFLSKMFSQIRMQAATNRSSHLKKHQTFDFFQTTDFLCNFQKSHFSKIFENHQ